MEKSHKIYNLIFDFLLAAVVCFYNDLRFMRFWFLGGRLYHATGFACRGMTRTLTSSSSAFSASVF